MSGWRCWRVEAKERDRSAAEFRRKEAEVRERIAQEIEAARVEFGDMWVDGDLVIDGRTYRLTKEIARTMNAVREMDARIARGGAK